MGASEAIQWPPSCTSLKDLSFCGSIDWLWCKKACGQCSTHILIQSSSHLAPCTTSTWGTPQSMDHPAGLWKVQGLYLCPTGWLNQDWRVLQLDCRLRFIYIFYVLCTTPYCLLLQLIIYPIVVLDPSQKTDHIWKYWGADKLDGILKCAEQKVRFLFELTVPMAFTNKS